MTDRRRPLQSALDIGAAHRAYFHTGGKHGLQNRSVMNLTKAQRLAVAYADVAAAAATLEGIAHRTPALTSRTVDERTGARVFFKCENLQRIGAFKFRGAYNALSQLSPEERKRGVLSFSSGNHAQAVALA